MVEMATRRGLAHGAQAFFGAQPTPVRRAERTVEPILIAVWYKLIYCIFLHLPKTILSFPKTILSFPQTILSFLQTILSFPKTILSFFQTI
jgi:hypothetical protein